MNNLNTARAPNIKHDSIQVKVVSYFAERVSHMLEVKINHLRIAMQKSDNLPNIDMFMIMIQALELEWVQLQIEHLVKSRAEKEIN
jgi:hypothetical protein